MRRALRYCAAGASTGKTFVGFDAGRARLGVAAWCRTCYESVAEDVDIRPAIVASERMEFNDTSVP
jgi:hypothetical protein